MVAGGRHAQFDAEVLKVPLGQAAIGAVGLQTNVLVIQVSAVHAETAHDQQGKDDSLGPGRHHSDLSYFNNGFISENVV